MLPLIPGKNNEEERVRSNPPLEVERKMQSTSCVELAMPMCHHSRRRGASGVVWTKNVQATCCDMLQGE